MCISAFDAEHAVMGVFYVASHIVSPVVMEVKLGITQLFLAVGHLKALNPLIDALETAGVEAALVDDIERRMWMKQLFLVPFAILNAKMHQPIGKICEDAAARKRWSEIAIEIAHIAQACDITMPVDPAAASLAVADRFDPQAASSFARDEWANRPHDAEPLMVPLLQRASNHGGSSPLLQQAFDYFRRSLP